MVFLVHGVGADRNDLPRAACQVDHPAVADDELSVGAPVLGLPVSEGQQVAVPEGAAQFEAELRALENRAEKASDCS